LASLDSLPGSHPMNRPQISTNLEIVLDQAEGRIVRMGITKTSGVTAFDIAALESVNRAQPFGPPPREIVSPDGNVYFHWEFWREPYYACSTYFARPYILKVKPKSAPPAIEPPPTRPGDPSEDPGGDQHGSVPRTSSTVLARSDHDRHKRP
jgi:TonB family protein